MSDDTSQDQSTPLTQQNQSAPLTQSGRRSAILDDLRRFAGDMRRAEDELDCERVNVMSALEEGRAAGIPIARLAREAGISRQTAHKLLRQVRLRRLGEDAERLEELRRLDCDGRLDVHGQAEYQRLLDDPVLTRYRLE